MKKDQKCRTHLAKGKLESYHLWSKKQTGSPTTKKVFSPQRVKLVLRGGKKIFHINAKGRGENSSEAQKELKKRTTTLSTNLKALTRGGGRLNQKGEKTAG